MAYVHEIAAFFLQVGTSYITCCSLGGSYPQYGSGGRGAASMPRWQLSFQVASNFSVSQL